VREGGFYSFPSILRPRRPNDAGPFLYPSLSQPRLPRTHHKKTQKKKSTKNVGVHYALLPNPLCDPILPHPARGACAALQVAATAHCSRSTATITIAARCRALAQTVASAPAEGGRGDAAGGHSCHPGVRAAFVSALGLDWIGLDGIGFGGVEGGVEEGRLRWAGYGGGGEVGGIVGGLAGWRVGSLEGWDVVRWSVRI